MLWFAVCCSRQFRQWFALLVHGGASSTSFVQAAGVIEMGSVTVSSQILGSRRQSTSSIEHSCLGGLEESGRGPAQLSHCSGHGSFELNM